QEALDIALCVAKALGARVLDEVHVMRKTVADGSAVSAFQRTALVAVDGVLDTSLGPVAVPTICLEEESCGIVEKKDDKSVYRLDRLGIPLIELATDASIKSGAHAREVAEKIGWLLRATGRVQRGLGTIRQDLNVSIAGGGRVEIKGAQALEDVAALVDNEAARQAGLVEVRRILRERGFEKLAFGKPSDVSRVFAGAKSFLSKPLSEGHVALALKLLYAKGLLGKEFMPGHRFGTEVSDYAKAKSGVKGIVHSDEDPQKYGLTSADFETIAADLDCGAQDGWAVVVAEHPVAVRALHAAFDRVYALDVPKETRRAEGQNSRFMRPLPGAARMYPETDVLPEVMPPSRLAHVSAPKSMAQRKEAYLALGLNAEITDKLLRSHEWDVFEQIASKENAKTLALLLLDVKPQLRRQGVDAELSAGRVREIVEAVLSGAITRAAMLDVAALAAHEPGVPVEKLADAAGLRRVLGDALRKLAASLDNHFGEVMKRHRLVVDAGELQAFLSVSRKGGEAD
ncbi:MAG: Glu-tRNA(Gln) amidotransferase subunit GatE, partial [Candidatus Micrarchaeota archaeon]|nr:Glu-tRNA(Gln) amidotransferase subunit GatE [Candidatus Micrarchaeota archaeon]